MQRTQRVLFSFQFGASLTFGSCSKRPQRIARAARRLTRRVSSARTLRTAPRVLYARPVGRVQKRPQLARRLGPHKALKKESSKELHPPRIAKRWTRGKPPKKVKAIKPAKPIKPVKPAKRAKPARATQVPRPRTPRTPRAPRAPLDWGWLWSGCDRLATALLVAVSLLLAGYAGAGLATVARLRYDPTTFLPAREMYPEDLARALRHLPRAAWATLAHAHAAPLALLMPRWLRFFMLMIYAGVTAGAVAWELRLARREGPALLRRLRAGRANVLHTIWNLNAILEVLVSWNVPYLDVVKTLIWEFAQDTPMNYVVGQRAAEWFVGLQAAAAALAVLAAVSGLRRDRRYY